MNEYALQRLEEGDAPVTVNRRLSALKRMFSLAVKAGRLDKIQHIPMLKERNTRKGFFEHSDFIKLRDALPEHLGGVVTFGYKTGWRFSEVVTLTWARVDRREGIVCLEAGETKNEQARTVYLDGEVKQILEAEWKRRKKLSSALPYVFLNKDGTDRVKRFYKRWKTACKNAGIGIKLFHDFWRTAARHPFRAGSPERVAVMVTGHKTRAVFGRYNIVSKED